MHVNCSDHREYMQLLEMMDILFYYDNHFSICIMFCMLNIHNKLI